MKSILRKGMVALLTLSLILTSLGTLGFAVNAAANNNSLVNGNFENGTNGFNKSGAITTFEVIADPDNSNNHVLHAVGAGGYYQTVTVQKNTDYVWSFRMKDIGNTGGTKVLVHPDAPAVSWNSIATEVIENSSQAYSKLDNGGAFIATYDKTWQNFTIKFNSGENTKVKLWHNLWAANREVYMDDWKLYREPKAGEILNSDFEDGTYSYSASGVTTFETIADPDNANNHILHVVGGGGYHQAVIVEPNTEYTWTFRMKDLGNTGGTKITVHPTTDWSSLVTSITEDSTEAYATVDASGVGTVATYNKTWQTFTVKFNSGENTTVKLWQNMWANTREVYMDDWKLTKKPGVNEITNADFEDGLDNWSTTTQLKAEVVTNEVHSGSKALKLGAKGAWNNAFLYQEVTLEKNTDYVWSYWFKCDSSATANKILAGVRTVDGTKLLPSTLSSEDGFVDSSLCNFSEERPSNVSTNWHQGMTTSDWRKYTVAFNSGEYTSVYLTIDMFYDNRAGWTDDWSLTKLGTIENAGFESETVADGYTVENITAAIETTEVHGGSQSLKLESTGDWENSRLSQTVKVMPNTDYAWTFWYKSTTPGKPSYVAVRSADGSNVLPSFINSTGTILKNPSFLTERAAAGVAANWHETLVTENWCKYVVTFNSGDNTEVQLTLNLHATGRGGYVDDWSIEEWNVTAGDANNDGTIDAVDLTVLKKYLLTGVKTFYKSGLDANETNGIDIRDLVSLKKKII